MKMLISLMLLIGASQSQSSDMVDAVKKCRDYEFKVLSAYKEGDSFSEFIKSYSGDDKDFYKTCIPLHVVTSRLPFREQVNTNFLHDLIRFGSGKILVGNKRYSNNPISDLAGRLCNQPKEFEKFITIYKKSGHPIDSHEDFHPVQNLARCFSGTDRDETSIKNLSLSIKTYIDQGGNVNYRDRNGENALFGYISSWDMLHELFKSLVEDHSANIKVINNEGQTLLHRAAELGDSVRTAEYLLSKKVSAKKKDKSGHTALQVFKFRFGTSIFTFNENRNEYAMLQLLKKVTPYKLSMTGVDLMEAIWKGNTKYALKLINHYKVNVNHKNYKNDNPLIYASHKENEIVVSELLKAGANPNLINGRGCCDSVGVTALHVAVKSKNIPIIKLLTSAGADIESKGYYFEKTPIDLANEIADEQLKSLVLEALLDNQ